MSISPNEFGASFRGFLEQMSTAAPAEEPTFRKRLREHFEQEPDKLPTLTEKFEPYDHANLHLAIESELSESKCAVKMLGIISPHEFMGASLSQLVAPAKSGMWGDSSPSEGPVEYVNIALEDNRVLACVQSGLYLVKRQSSFVAQRKSSIRWHRLESK